MVHKHQHYYGNASNVMATLNATDSARRMKHVKHVIDLNASFRPITAVARSGAQGSYGVWFVRASTSADMILYSYWLLMATSRLGNTELTMDPLKLVRQIVLHDSTTNISL